MHLPQIPPIISKYQDYSVKQTMDNFYLMLHENHTFMQIEILCQFLCV